MRLQYTYSRLADCKVWFSSATKAESVAWAICALNAHPLQLQMSGMPVRKKPTIILMGLEAHLMKLNNKHIYIYIFVIYII